MTRRVVLACLYAAFLTLLAAQLVPVERSNPPSTSEIPASPEVRAILRRSCYDCHSNATRWPWYSRVAPVSWLVASDVAEGRESMNFSTWDAYSPKEAEAKRREIGDEVSQGDMPPWSYRAVHPESRLSEADRGVLDGWSRGATEVR